MVSVTIFETAGDGEKKSYRGISCKGHAGFSKEGTDIVCAAVSMLVINTVNALEALTGLPMDARQNGNEGVLEVSFLNEPNERGEVLMDALVLGLKEVKKVYGGRYLSLHFKEV